MPRHLLPLSPSVLTKTPPWPEKRSRFDDVKRPIRHKVTVSRHHLGGTGTLGVGGLCSEWPSQPRKEKELEENYYTKLVVTC